MRNSVLALMVVMLSSASGYVTGYHVEPVKAAWSGCTRTVPGQDTVVQTVTCNFDSLSYVELFAGAKENGGTYRAGVWLDGSELMWSYGSQGYDCRWVRFDNWNTQVAFTKGKVYEVRFTRGGSDSIQYYYSGGDPYPYGTMLVPGQGPTDRDLACRVYGRMNPVSDVWRACVNHGNDPSGGAADTDVIMADSMGVKWIRDEFASWNGWEYSRQLVESIYNRYVNGGLSMIGILDYGPPYASWSSRGPDTTFPPQDYLPRNLWGGQDQSDTNYWAYHCHEIMSGLPEVKFWEVWNEPNTPWGPRDPDILYYQGGNTTADSIHTWRERCSLYVRMCNVAESVAHVLDGDTAVRRRKILAGATYRLLDGDGVSMMPGVEWLRNVLDLAEHRYGGVESCFDIASVHPYRWDWNGPDNYFNETLFSLDLDTARAVMRAAGYPGMELWATEYGWPRWHKQESVPTVPLTDSLMQARDNSQFYISAIARQADPRGGYDRAIHYELTSYRGSKDNNGFGLLDSLPGQPLMPQGWAFAQVDSLTGKRLNGRVMMGGTKDDSVRVYEFEDPTSLKKTWVCWENAPASGTPPTVAVKLPARVDTSSAKSLDYGDNPSLNPSYADADGWLRENLGTRPVFITEKSDTSRADLVVDSLKLVPSPVAIGHPATAHVYFHNAGDTTTPEGPATGEYGFVVLRHNGDSVAYAVDTHPLAPNHSDSITISVASVPSGWHGTGLFDATANYGQVFVELNGMDDNDGYSRNSVIWKPYVEIGDIMYGSHGNEPLVLLGLHTYSKERDTTGQTPCDSARFVEWWYGLNDTVVHGGDTTPWFCVNRATTFDTSMQFLSGQGKYKLFLQAKDSWSMSDLIPDSAHSYVFFDTTGPTGSTVINHGSRFTTSSTCTLKLAAQDSGSGVARMHFANIPKVNLVKNGSFTATGGSWSYSGSGSGYDTTLGMAKLATGGSTCVRQFIPAESISAYSGDSCVLQASVMALMHGGNALGDVSVWYYRTRQDTSLHDTLWTLVDSASFQDSLAFWGQSPCGGSSLTRRFLLTVPAAESGWVWRGGMVRVQAVGVNGAVGTVYADVVALNGFKPDTGYAWWGPYETLTTWNIGASAGQHIVRACYVDSAGNENSGNICDTIMLDPTAPVVHISLPSLGQMVNGTVEITGWAYDSVEVSGDTWFKERRLYYRSADSTNWRPVCPDSISHAPAYPNWQFMNPAVHLGYWNTTPILNGQYYLKLASSDSAGNSSSCSTWVMVQHGRGGGMSRLGPSGGGTGVGQGSVYAGSATGCVLHLSDDLDSLDAFQVTDSGSQAYVTSVLEVGNDSLLVLDARNKRIHKLHRNGQGRRRLVSNLSLPMGLTKDDDGNFWLVDKGLNRIGKFRSDGTLVFVRGGLGTDSLHFHSPEAIAVEGSLVYVADTKNDRISVWDTSGNYQTTITGDFANPTSVMVTDPGTIYLTDGNDGNLKGITPLGGNIATIVSQDSSKLRGLVLSDNGHWLFTLAPQPNEVYKLQVQSDESMPGGVQSSGNVILPKVLCLNQPFPNPARTRLHISYALPRPTRVSVKLYDISGKLVNTLASGDKKAGYYYLVWNRQDAKGRSCPCGVYFCTMSAENQRFSKKVVLTD